MRVEQIMTRTVRTCSPADPLSRAAAIMWEEDCGCVPVVKPAEDGAPRVVGLVTDRDACMAAFTQGRSLDEIAVSTAMSHEVCSCHPNDPVSLAVKILCTRQLHRLPVVEGDDRLVGILSLADVAREAEREHSSAVREVTDQEVAETLEAICTPRRTEGKLVATA